jgi:hypothetical protein
VVSNTYCVVLLFCFSSSCVPYVASFVLYPNIELTSVLTNSVILLDVHSALRILFPNYYPLVNEVAKGYGNAGFSVVFMNQVIPSNITLFVRTLVSSVLRYPLRFPHKNTVLYVIYVCLASYIIVFCFCFIFLRLVASFLWIVHFRLPLLYSLTFI